MILLKGRFKIIYIDTRKYFALSLQTQTALSLCTGLEVNFVPLTLKELQAFYIDTNPEIYRFRNLTSLWIGDHLNY